MASSGPQPTANTLHLTEDVIDLVSDSDDDSVDDDDHLDLWIPLQWLPNRKVKYLNLTDDYVKSWRCDEAFRECYQNWRDGILRSFKLKLWQFKTIYSDDTKKRRVLIEARNPDTTDLLGFIEFKYDKERYCVGGLKMANFKATLQYNNLGTGGTTKAADKNQTGQHGEGLKLSALVFRRNHYNFRIESGSFKWSFIFKKGELACQLSRMSDKKLRELKSKRRGPSELFTAHPWEDVCVIIAAPGKARTARGQPEQSAKLHVDDFKKWLKVTLDIDPPVNMVSTSKGDLIRDPLYRSKIYLHGLLLPSGGIKGPNYAYGYNLKEGHTNRDRDSLAGAGEESKSITAIWASAIRSDEETRSDLVTEYTMLLLNSLNKKGDVMLSSSGDGLDKDIAQQVWDEMRTKKDLRGRSRFYYQAEQSKDEVRIIEQSLRMDPYPLDPEMWNLIHAHGLCRTPAEELRHRFESAGVVQVPQHSFALHMERLLRCLLSSSPAMERMELNFVEGGSLDIDAGFFAETWKIHDKWLTHEGVHNGVSNYTSGETPQNEREGIFDVGQEVPRTFCDETSPGPHDTFACDHAVLELWDIMIAQLMDTGNHPDISLAARHLKSLARARVAQMPRHVACTTTTTKGALRVTWESVDSHRFKDELVRITLHSEDCYDATNPINVPKKLLGLVQDAHRCKCPFQLSKNVSDGVTFQNLDSTKSYIPDVSRDEQGAFIAVQPMPIKPLDRDRTVRVDVRASVIPILGTVEHTHQVDSDEDATMCAEGGDDGTSDDDIPRQAVRDSSTLAPLPDPSGMGPDLDSEGDSAVNNICPSSSVPTVNTRSTSRTSASVRPQSRGAQAQTDGRESVLKHDAYKLGTKIEHRSLDWGGSFPGSHDFYRTREKPEEDIFILKPKAHHSGVSKRPHEFEDRVRRSKQPRCETANADNSMDET
ncbi:hypothetical protein NX059_008658 [Plenodomus lindquistii]|nr:hypothetical protein NX059_008658 [Plenodomus lindquistii]